MYRRYLFAHEAIKLSFSELSESLLAYDREVSLEQSFRSVLRVKRGVMDTTRHFPAYYAKDKAYLDGFLHVQDWVANGGDTRKLLEAKIKIGDLVYFS